MRRPQDSSAPACAVAAATVPSTRGACGSVANSSASAIMASPSSMARFTPEATTGLPANRFRSRTPTSAAKIAASAAAMTSACSGVEPAEPWVSTWMSTPARAAAASRASAAM